MTLPPPPRLPSGLLTDHRGGGPLRNGAFRALWVAATFSYVGTWVQDVGESWLMLSLTRSPLPVAMLTTSFTLPAFMLTLPAGVLADRFDRRKILLVAQSWMALVALGLAVVAWRGWVTPAVLLFAGASLGVGAAVTSPPWQSLLPDLVPRAQTAEAVTLNSVAFNIARAVGPALGGLVLGLAGPATAFALNAASFLAVIEVLRRYPHIRAVAERAGAARRKEPLRKAIFVAFRQVRRSSHLRALYTAVAAFGLAASGVVALLPVFAKNTLHTDARGYGVLLGAIGIGAVSAALLLRRLRASFSARRLVPGAMVVYGAAMLAMSLSRSLPLAAFLLVPAGAGWLSALSTTNALVQLNAPAWAKSRILALYQVCFLAAWSVGATLAGVLATRYGAELTMALAAVGTLGAAVVSARVRLPSYDEGISNDAYESPPLSTPPPAASRVL